MSAHERTGAPAAFIWPAGRSQLGKPWCKPLENHLRSFLPIDSPHCIAMNSQSFFRADNPQARQVDEHVSSIHDHDNIRLAV